MARTRTCYLCGHATTEPALVRVRCLGRGITMAQWACTTCASAAAAEAAEGL